MTDSRERLAEVLISPAMVEVGVEVLSDLEGQVMKATLVEAIYRAMALEAAQLPPRIGEK